MTREEWLTRAANTLLDEVIMPETEAPRPPFRVSVGWPKGKRGNQALGVCHPRALSGDGVNEIYITPNVESPTKALAMLTHELIHALTDCQTGHKGEFAAIAHAVGFEAPLTTLNPSPSLIELCEFYANELGDYPHARLGDSPHRPKTDRNRQLKLECDACGLILRGSQTAINSMPCPANCPACSAPTLHQA